MKFKLKRIDWYIIKQFLGTYVFAIALIISISVVFDINEKIDKFLNPDVPLKAIIVDYYLNFIPYFANLFSPLFTFIAVIFFTSKLADRSEIIAMLASGMSFRRLMLPYAVSATIIAIVTFILNAYIIPPANETRIDFQNKYIRNKKVDYVKNAQLEIEPGIIAYFDSYDAHSNMGYRFSLEHFENRSALKETIENAGGKVTGSVTQKTSYLINNDIASTSSKNKKAKELGVPIITEEQAMEQFGLS